MVYRPEMKEDRLKDIVKVVLIVTLLLILSQAVIAMGVGPSRQFISFAPGQKIEGELLIINDNNEHFRAAVYPQGAFEENIKIGTPLVDVNPEDAMVSVPYEINFPLTAPKPGKHTMEIVVRQFPPDTDVAQPTVSANMALIAQIIVQAPYPGKYAEAKLYITESGDMDTPTKFGFSIFNFGTEDIANAYAEIDIFAPNMEKVAELTTNKRPIKSKEEGKLQVDWRPAVEKGTYKAMITVFYDDKDIKIERDFDLGMFVIDVSDIKVENFRLGDVAKFDILLFNSWNTRLEDVYVEMSVEDSKGKEMTEFKTAAVEIPAKQAKTLEAYWYTEGVAPGIYKVKLIVHYAGKMTQKEYDFEVDTNSITKLGATGEAVSAEDIKEVSTQGLIILLIIIVLVLLIGMNIVWFYFLSRRLKGKGGEK
jgi:hypothetical protein